MVFRIILTGADGSGKTTLAQVLAFYLSRYGVAMVFWVRGSHLFASLLLRFLSKFVVFKGFCNPYYRVCLPSALKRLWIHIEFWSFLPYLLLEYLLSKLYTFFISDRGIIDFVVWIVVTLEYPKAVSCIYGRFLLKLASKEIIVFTNTDLNILKSRSDVPFEFLVKEFTVYNVLSRYFSKLSINTRRCKPPKCVALILKKHGKSSYIYKK